MKSLLNALGALVLAVFLTLPPLSAYAEFTLEDNFNDPSHRIAGSRWVFGAFNCWNENVALIDAALLEALGRPVPDDPKVLMAARSTFGGFCSARYNALNDATAVGIKADVAMLSCEVSTAGFGQVEARLQGGFSNDGSSTGPGDETGDILGRVQFLCKQDAPGAPVSREVSWSVLRCGDPLCETGTTLGRAVLIPDAPLGQVFTMSVRGVGNNLAFSANGATATFTPGATAPPRVRFVQFGVTSFQTAPGGEGVVIATFDNVFIDRP